MVSPVQRIAFLAAGDGPPEGVTLVFTSASAVAAVAGQADFARHAAWAVGAATARAARDAGFSCRAAGGDARALVAALAADPPRGPVLHLRGVHGRGDVAASLRALGIDAEERIVYDQVAQDLNAEAEALLQGRAPVILPLFSPRSAMLMRGATITAPLCVVAISAAAALAWGRGDPVEVATTPDAAAMADAVRRVRSIG